MAPAASRTRAAGRAAVAGVAGLWLLAGACFVAPRGPVQGGLRGSAHELEVRPFEAQAMGAEEAPRMSMNAVLSAAAAFGMVVAMTTSPVRAEEAAAPAAAPVDKMAQFKAEADKEAAAIAGAKSKEERTAEALAKAAKVQLDGEFASKSAETPKATRKSAAKLIKKESKKQEAAVSVATAYGMVVRLSCVLSSSKLN